MIFRAYSPSPLGGSASVSLFCNFPVFFSSLVLSCRIVYFNHICHYSIFLNQINTNAYPTNPRLNQKVKEDRGRINQKTCGVCIFIVTFHKQTIKLTPPWFTDWGPLGPKEIPGGSFFKQEHALKINLNLQDSSVYALHLAAVRPISQAVSKAFGWLG